MGATNSKERISELERQQKALMKHNADMAQRLVDQEEANKRQNEAMIQQMAI
ncbi:unnamed protein product, partial [Rotaria magnacalcarata]